MTGELDDRARQVLVSRLLDRHGRSYAEEIGLDLTNETAWFGWLCAALLMSARISAEVATRAAQALIEAGLDTPGAMARSSWSARVALLDRTGYVRYDERTARMLGEMARRVLDLHGGTLGQLRETARHDPAEERRLLLEFKGIGPVGADIFLREMQLAWPELYPFADARARKAAARLGLPDKAGDLAGLVPRAEFPRLLAALVRADLSHETDRLRLDLDS